MKMFCVLLVGLSAFVMSSASSPGEVRVTADRNSNEEATEEFKFKNVPSPTAKDAASKAVFTIVDGVRDGNGGEVSVLNDDKLPEEGDQPAANFFFQSRKETARLQVDLGNVIDVRQVNTYSWHPGARGPQVYSLYASDGKAAGFDARPKHGIDPAKCGWKLVANVDTRSKQDKPGGQYGVSISDSGAAVGKYRYLLFSFSRTDDAEPFSATFYSEIDVIDGNAPAQEAIKPAVGGPGLQVVEADGGKYRISIDSTEAPDLTEWAGKELAPVVKEWYPKLVMLLPSDGYEAPKKVKIVFSRDYKGVAATGGTRIRCSAEWYRKNFKGEGLGSIIHEMVHVVQQYGLAKQKNPKAIQVPGWLTEGITDYIRWYIYEPQSHGARVSKDRAAKVHYNDSYRVTANFLDWVTGKYEKDLIVKLNATIRDGKYSEDVWKQFTGHTAAELEAEWKQDLAK